MIVFNSALIMEIESYFLRVKKILSRPTTVARAAIPIPAPVGITVQDIRALTIATPALRHPSINTKHESAGSIARPPMKPAKKYIQVDIRTPRNVPPTLTYDNSLFVFSFLKRAADK